MTTREHLNKHRKWSLIATYSGVPILFAAVVIGVNGEHHAPNIPLMIIGWLLCMSGWIATMLGGKCLHCGQRLTAMFLGRFPGPFLKISEHLHFCPCCGKSLDKAPAENPATNNQLKG